MRVYKVVVTIDGKYFSALHHGKYTLEYKVGEKTVPKVGKIFAFRALEDAIRFGSGINVFLSEAENVTKCPNFLSAWPQDYQAYWNRQSVERYPNTTPGVVLCDSLTLLEKIC